MQSCTNDMTIRNMSTNVIWSFFTKLKTDVSIRHSTFLLSVCCVSMDGGLIKNG